MTNDWIFDIGYKTPGNLAVEPYASTILDVRLRGLSRAHLQELQHLIADALKRYPQPYRDSNYPNGRE